jgi:hypothetical protein
MPNSNSARSAHCRMLWLDDIIMRFKSVLVQPEPSKVGGQIFLAVQSSSLSNLVFAQPVEQIFGVLKA